MSAATMTMRTLIPAAVGVIALLQPAWAEPAAEVRVTYSNGQFQPGVVNAPVDKPVVIHVRNLDAKALEFESTSLRVEKVVAGQSEGIVNVRALKPGRYEFYDDFNDKAHGALVVE